MADTANSRAEADWPIFVLTLEGDDERRAPLEKSLQRMGLPYELVFGVDGRNGLPPEYEDQIDRPETIRRLAREMSDGEYACALSHRAIYHRVVEDGFPGAIVLEDDAILKEGFVELIHSRDFERFPMVLMDHRYARAVRFSYRKAGVGGVYRIAGQCTLTVAYTVRADAALRLIRATTPVSYTADWPSSLYELNAWVSVPRVATQTMPDKKRSSHLAAGRKAMEGKASGDTTARAEGVKEYLRRRLSARVGRARGEP